MSEFIRLQANGVDAYPDASTENTYRSNGTSVESALLALESNVNTLGGVAGEAKTLAEQNSVKIATAEQEISDINSSLESLNSNLSNKGKYYELGKFSSTGSKALSDNALNYEELVVYGNVSSDDTNYVIDTMRIQPASIKANQYFIVALNDGTNRKGQFIFSTNGDNIIIDKLDNVSSLTVYGITKKS